MHDLFRGFITLMASVSVMKYEASSYALARVVGLYFMSSHMYFSQWNGLRPLLQWTNASVSLTVSTLFTASLNLMR